MKRIVFATVGSLGDLHPYIAIGRALRARGHSAVIATTDRYRVAVEAAGIEYASLRPAEAQFGGLESVAGRLFDPIHGPGYLIREMVMPHLRDQYADLVQACTDAHLLVTHPLTLAGPLVCQKRGLAWASSVLAPISLMSCTDPPLLASSAPARLLRRLGPGACRLCITLGALLLRRWEQPLDAFRRELGLPRARHRALLQGQFSPLLNLALFPELVAAPQPDWPAGTVLTGFARYDGPTVDADLQARLDTFLAAGDPPIVFALGSSVVMVAGDFWHKAIAATTRLGRRAILLTGGHWSGTLPAGIAAFDYLPYSAVFPRAAAIVHQGGIGTFAQALSAGRPQLVVPLAFDQPDNARRAVRLGVARSIPIRDATASGLEEALSDLLSTPAYALAAQRAALSIGSGFDVGAERAADAILSALG
jgi:UDP:flavonoid glycosyltransferase YjiC (YdhE family)